MGVMHFGSFRFRHVNSAKELNTYSIGYKTHRDSLMVRWLRILLAMQGTSVQSLVWEDPTCHGAIKPVLHND